MAGGAAVLAGIWPQRSAQAATILSPDKFISYAYDWMNQHAADGIASAWPQAGGWEGWAQVDLASYILKQDSTIDLQRESVDVYASNPDEKESKKPPRPDYVLNLRNVSASQGSQVLVVELKCQSFGNYSNFVKGLEIDASKLEGGLNADFKKMKPQRISLGFFFTKEKTGLPKGYETMLDSKGNHGLCYRKI